MVKLYCISHNWMEQVNWLFYENAMGMGMHQCVQEQVQIGVWNYKILDNIPSYTKHLIHSFSKWQVPKPYPLMNPQRSRGV